MGDWAPGLDVGEAAEGIGFAIALIGLNLLQPGEQRHLGGQRKPARAQC